LNKQLAFGGTFTSLQILLMCFSVWLRIMTASRPPMTSSPYNSKSPSPPSLL
jgi:hypothetical protein